MSIQKVGVENTFSPKAKNQNNPSFKGIAQGLLNMSGTAMQKVENGGFAATFLIQDGLGMLTPRVWTGFNRDRKETKRYNVKEGLEVLLRESITGPVMMATPFILLGILGAIIGKTTFTNTNLIKRLGTTLKETAAKNPENLKQAFYNDTLKKISNETMNGKLSKEATDKILSKLDEMDIIEATKTLSKKAKKAQIKEKTNDIIEMFNNTLKSNTADFYNVNKIKLAGKEFTSAETVSALRGYAKDFSKISPEKLNPEEFMHKSIANRLFANILTLTATLAAMFEIPKIYAFNTVPPGYHEKTLPNEDINIKGSIKELRSSAKKGMKKNRQDNNEEDAAITASTLNTDSSAVQNPKKKADTVSFTGAYDKFGKVIAEKLPEKITQLFEFNGNNFTPALMTGISVGGLLIPRGKKAIERAPIQLDGNKDRTELNEVLLRDTASTAGVIFAVPVLSNVLVKTYEKSTGFVLRHGGNVIKNAELKEIYGNLNSPEKINNFCQFISGNKGDLRKVLGSLDYAEELLNLKTYAKENVATANSRITEAVKQLKESDIIKLLSDKVPRESGVNKMITKARNLNSVPGLISTFVLSPILLGILIPKLTYKLTHKAHEEERLRMAPENINKLFSKINPNNNYSNFNQWIK